MKKSKIRWTAILKFGLAAAFAVVIILVFISGGRLFPAEEQILAPPLIEPDPIIYDTLEVQLGNIENKLSLRAYFQPKTRINLFFSGSEGYLKKMHVSTGDMVTKGQLLAELNMESVERELQRQRIHLEELKDHHLQLSAVSAIDYSVNQMHLDEAKRNLEIEKQLGNHIAITDLQKYENQLRIQEQNYNKIVLEYEYKIASSERDIKLAELAIEELEIQRSRARILAPVNGKISYTAYLNEGEYIEPYKTVITIADTSELILEYKGKEHEYLQPGMAVDIIYNNKHYNGKVLLTPRQISAEDFKQLQELVTFSVDESIPDCRPGDSAKVEVLLDWVNDVIVLPRRLVYQYSGRSMVKILEDGLVNEVDVSIGLQSATQCEITHGLEPGDLVVR